MLITFVGPDILFFHKERRERVIRSKGAGLWPELLELGFLTHCAYGCLKKRSSTAVVKEAGGFFFGGEIEQNQVVVTCLS